MKNKYVAPVWSSSTEVQMAVSNPIRSLDGTKLVTSIYIRFTRSGLREGTFGCALAEVGVHDMLKV